MSSKRTPEYRKTLRALNVPDARPIVMVSSSDGSKGIVVSIYRVRVTPKGAKSYYRYTLACIGKEYPNLAFKKEVSSEDAREIAKMMGVKISTHRSSTNGSGSNFKWRLPF